MNKENTQALFARFPELFAGKDMSIKENLMPFGFECGDGWFDLIWKLCEDIEATNEKVLALQVKEKFGGLRFYVTTGSNKVLDLINEAEAKSMTICERCGKLGILHQQGWWHTICDECEEKREKAWWRGEK